MKVVWIISLLLIYFGRPSDVLGRNVSSRPAVVNVGAFFSYESTIGRVAKVAIEEAVKDVNANPSVLPGTKLVVRMRNSNCSGFLGIIGALQFMETEAVAIIGPQSSVVAHVISNVASELQVPLLSFAATDPTLSPIQFPFFVRTTQSDLYQMTAVADIVDHYDWRQVIAIFIDDDYGRNGVSALDDALAAKGFKVSYKAGIPPGPNVSRADIMDILTKVALQETRVIVLHTYRDSGFMVFSVAHYLGMINEGYVWIATDWLASVLDSSSPLPPENMDSMQGVLVLRQHTPDTERKKAFLSRWEKLTGGSLGLNTYALNAYDSVWMVAHAVDSFFNQGGIISFSNYYSKLLAAGGGDLHLEEMSIFNGGMLLLKNILQSDFVGLTGHFKFSSDRSLIYPAYDVINVVGTGIRRIGYWSNYSGLSTVPPETLYLRPPNRSRESQQLYGVVWPGETVKKPRGWVFPNSGKVLKIGVPIRVGYREFVSHVPGTNNFKGFCVDVFTAAINLLPYAVQYQFVAYGDGRKNPSYTALVDSVASGVFDGAIGDITIVTNRTRIVDFTQPYFSSGLVVVSDMRKLNTGPWAFLRPFSATMWGITAAFLVAVGVVVWILEHRTNEEFRGPPKQQLKTILWFSLSTVFPTQRQNTESTLGRVVVIIWLFVVLIINSSYTANLTSILTVQQPYSPIKGVETLRKINEPVGYQVGSFAEHYLMEEIGIPKSRLVSLGAPEEYTAALERGDVAAIVDELPYVDLFLSRHCKFGIVGQEFTKSGWGFAFPRDSPLAVDMSTAILTLSQNGELQRMQDKWLTGRSCSSDTTKLESKRLHLSSFVGLYMVCGIACFIALVAFFIRIMRQYREASRANPIPEPRGRRHSLQRFKRLHTLLSFIDGKEEHYKQERKRRKVQTSLSDDTNAGVTLGNPNMGRAQIP